MIICEANEKELEKAVHDKAENYPEIECIWNENAKDYYQDLDFLCITSLNESQPLVMLEALAHKALPIGPEVGDLTNKFGLTFNPDTKPEQITQCVQALWNQQPKFISEVEKRHQQVRKFHTWEYIFDSYRQMINNLGASKNYSNYGT